MKTINYNPILVVLILALNLSFVSAQEYTSSTIDVRGSRYGDTMWMFTVPGTSDSFDNGWDGVKMLGSSLAPQIYGIGPDNIYQVFTTDNIDETVIGFKPGEDNQYTFTFTHYSLEMTYQELYLVDRVANVTVDIYAQGVTYTFSCAAGDQVDRFSIIAVLNSAVVEEPVDNDPITNPGDTVAPEDTVVVEDPIVEEEPIVVEDPIVEEPVVEEPVVVTKPGKNNPKANPNSVKVVSNYGSTVVIDNTKDIGAIVSIYDVYSGRLLGQYQVNEGDYSTQDTNLPSGAYIVNVRTATSQTSTRVLF